MTSTVPGINCPPWVPANNHTHVNREPLPPQDVVGEDIVPVLEHAAGLEATRSHTLEQESKMRVTTIFISKY